MKGIRANLYMYVVPDNYRGEDTWASGEIIIDDHDPILVICKPEAYRVVQMYLKEGLISESEAEWLQTEIEDSGLYPYEMSEKTLEKVHQGLEQPGEYNIVTLESPDDPHPKVEVAYPENNN